MSEEDRRLFLFPITICGYIAAFLIIPLLLIWAEFQTQHRFDTHSVAYFMVLGIPLVAWFGFRGFQIVRSIHRYNDGTKKQMP